MRSGSMILVIVLVAFRLANPHNWASCKHYQKRSFVMTSANSENCQSVPSFTQ